MVLAAILSILLIAVCLAWYGKKFPALYFFGISFISAILWFFHHMTDVIGLSL